MKAMRAICTALLAAAAVSFAAWADEAPETLSNAVPKLAVPSEPTFAQFGGEEGSPRHRVLRVPQARQGMLISFGLGGGSMWDSSFQTNQRAGAFDFNFRLGYGFSDRFQMFMDLSADAGTHPSGVDLASWTLTFRGQTVLIGDRAGNGLNLNFGAGIGGMTYNSNSCCYGQTSSPTGFALAGGISYDARVSLWFALSPEFFYTWHEIPDGYSDVATFYGLRLNFLWYLH